MADREVPDTLSSSACSPWFGGLDLLTAAPGRLLELCGREFVVVSPWSNWGPLGLASRPVLLPWQPGTRGIVIGVQYTSAGNWEVDAEYQGQCIGFEVDEINPKIPLRDFLRHTAPVTAYRVQNQEAANDPE